MTGDLSQARYYLRAGLTALDNLGEPLQEHLGHIYGQWFAEAGSRLPDELAAEWANVRARMTAHEAIGANTVFVTSAALMSDAEAKAVVDDIAAIMVKLGHDND